MNAPFEQSQSPAEPVDEMQLYLESLVGPAFSYDQPERVVEGDASYYIGQAALTSNVE